MKKILIILLTFLSISLFAQTYKTVTLVSQTSKYLNSGGRAWVGGVSRIPIRVDLPANTVEWYYSFTTSAGESGTSLLNLAVQIGAYATTGPLGATVAKSLTVPPGSSSVDIWLMPFDQKENFVAKKDDKVKIYSDLSDVNTKQDVKMINTLLTGSYYLGLRNPSALEAVNITIEVVALVKTDAQSKGATYGSLGWKSYESGDTAKAILYSKKALELDSTLSWVQANLGLFYLIRGDEIGATDYYVDAISYFKKDKLNGKYYFKAVIKDINDAKIKYPNLKGYQTILDLLNSEYTNMN